MLNRDGNGDLRPVGVRDRQRAGRQGQVVARQDALDLADRNAAGGQLGRVERDHEPILRGPAEINLAHAVNALKRRQDAGCGQSIQLV